MKPLHFPVCPLLFCLLLHASCPPALAQQQGGALIPTKANGALDGGNNPQRSHKTLEFIDPGTAIDPADFGPIGITINNPGSYYLTGNITTVSGSFAVITINASNVTLDLRGFALIANGGSGTAANHAAIGVVPAIIPYSNLTVRNGVISGPWYAGVLMGAAGNARCENLRIYQTNDHGISAGDGAEIVDCLVNGSTTAGFITETGISSGNASLVKNCTVLNCDGTGIWTGDASTVQDCAAYANSENGIRVDKGGRIVNSIAAKNGLSGLRSGNASLISQCTASDNDGDGILGGSGCVISHCASMDNGQATANVEADGIDVSVGSTVTNCTVRANEGDGIESGNQCVLINNLATSNTTFGISAGSLNLVRGNYSTANGGGNYSDTGGQIGPVQSGSTAISPTANF